MEKAAESTESDMRLKSCSTRKRKKRDSNKKMKTTPETLEQGNEGGADMSQKKKKEPQSNNVNVSHQQWNQLAEQHPQALKKGDMLNLSQLLFDKDRDFLITYDDRDHPVQAKHLENKVVVLHFVPLIPWSEDYMRFETTVLLDIYHDLHPKGGFEVVLIGVEIDTPNTTSSLSPLTLEKCFEDKFSIMPWPAIPFPYIKSSSYWEMIFPLSGFLTARSPTSFVIDPSGVVLQCNSSDIFHMYGARAYPFTDERLECVLREDGEARNHPSITKLLASSERDYLINNSNQAVPLHNLEDKVIALYFYEDDDELTSELLKAYELAQEKNFEIVLVYIHDSFLNFECMSEKSYWKTFSKMPWLALPFKDPVCKKLQRVFDYPMSVDVDEDGPDHSLVIIGPQGKFVERYGADILKEYGMSAYPFTRKRAAKLEVEHIKELKLNRFWGRKTTFVTKNGSMVQLSQLEGKRIMIIVEDDQHSPDVKFWRKLRARYLQVKGTSSEFEVIHMCKNKKQYSYGRNIAPVSWLQDHSRRHTHRWGMNELEILNRVFRGGVVGLLAFDCDGSIVRRTVFPAIGRGDVDFPFGVMKKEFLRGLIVRFEWDD